MARRSAISLSIAICMLAGTASAHAFEVSRLMAPPSVCAHQLDVSAPTGVQEQAMRCMTNFARQSDRRHRFGDIAKLDRSAGSKSRDILRCDSFSHFACGRPFTYWMQRVGYIPARCWRAGENIAWGVGSYGSVRSTFRSWMHSSAHRENILSHGFDQFGVGLDVGSLDGRSRAHVWTQEFGSHCRRPAGSPARNVQPKMRVSDAVTAIRP